MSHKHRVMHQSIEITKVYDTLLIRPILTKNLIKPTRQRLINQR